MKKLLAIFILRILWLIVPYPESHAAESVYADGEEWLFIRVIDGDSFQIRIPCLPFSLSLVTIRIRGIDTPELGDKAKCLEEDRLARLATRFTQNFLSSGSIRLEKLHWDKYGGRIDADVFVNNQSLGDALYQSGYARFYEGGKRLSWCFQ